MANTYKIASVGSPSSLVLSANSSAKRRIITNGGSYPVFLAGSANVVIAANCASGGFPLYSGDDPLYLNDYVGNVYAVCQTGSTATLYIVEEELS